MKTLIKNTQVIYNETIKRGLSVIIEGKKIINIKNDNEIDKSDYEFIIDGRGAYLSPGFIDIHHHGNSGFDTMDATHEAITEMAIYQAKHGVTSFLGATMTSPKKKILNALGNAKTYIEKNYKNQNVSDFLGIYLEGPYFSEEKKGAQPKEYIHKGNMDELNEFIKTSNQKIKVVAIAPELEGSLEIIATLKANDIKIAIGHSNATYEQAELGIEAGANIATHLYNGMKSFSHREPAIVGSVLTNPHVYAELIIDMVHLHKAAIQLAYQSKGKDKLILVSDAMRATGLKNGNYDLGGQMVEVKDGKAKLENGTIAGSTLSLDKAVKNMVDKVGIPLVEAIQMATINPAKALGIEERIGSIDIGKDADLVLLNEDLSVRDVILKGCLI